MSFLIKKLKERISFIEKSAADDDKKELLTDVHNTFKAMNAAGVNNDNDYRDFFYVITHVSKIANEVLNRKINQSEIAEISHLVFQNREDRPINTVYNFYQAVKAAIDNSETIKKEAYPQGVETVHIKPPYNLTNWVNSMREIYAFKTRGMDGQAAFNKVTENWATMEKKDFKHWLDFYESNSHLSYKMANKLYYDFGGAPAPVGYQQLSSNVPNMPFAEGDVQNTKQEKLEDTITEKIKQLIGRLNSAEKIYTSNDFKNLLGDEHEAWLATLHQLKRKIQTSSLKNASTIDDLIERFANQLQHKGLVKTAAAIVKFAQMAPPGDMGLFDSQLPGGDMGGPMGDPMGTGDEDLNDPDAAMDKFMENIGARPDKNRKKFEKKKEEENKNDANDIDDAEIVVSEENYYIDKRAQLPPAPTPKPTPEPIPEPIPTPLPTSDASPLPTLDKPEISNRDKRDIIDDKIDQALKDITIKDVIIKLEGLAQLYKNRPLATELNKVDFMMNSLGIASYFPNMAEAIKSALDSNQYVLTRIEDVLAKLRGADAVGSGQLEALKNKLDQAEENAISRREQREKQEMQPPAPEPEVPVGPPAELAEPVTVNTPTKPGVRV